MLRSGLIILTLLLFVASNESATDAESVEPMKAEKLKNNESVADSAVVNKTALNALAETDTLTEYIVDWGKVEHLTAGTGLSVFISWLHKDAILKKIATLSSRFSAAAMGIKAAAVLAVILVITGIVLAAFLYAVQIKVVHQDSIVLGHDVQQAEIQRAQINRLYEVENSKIANLTAKLNASVTSHASILKDLRDANRIIEEQKARVKKAQKNEKTHATEVRRELKAEMIKMQEKRDNAEKALSDALKIIHDQNTSLTLAEQNRTNYMTEYQAIVAHLEQVEQAFEEKQMVLYTYSISVQTAWNDVWQIFTSAAEGNTTQLWRFWDAAKEAFAAPMTTYKTQMSLLGKVKKPKMETSSATMTYLEPAWPDRLSTVLFQNLDLCAKGAMTVGAATAPLSVAILGFSSIAVPVVTIGSAALAGVATATAGHFAKKSLPARLWPSFEDLVWTMAWWIILCTVLLAVVFVVLGIVSFYALGMAWTIPIEVGNAVIWIGWECICGIAKCICGIAKCICGIAKCIWAIIVWTILKILFCRQSSAERKSNLDNRTVTPETSHGLTPENQELLATILRRRGYNA